jgi:hypothetical protein
MSKKLLFCISALVFAAVSQSQEARNVTAPRTWTFVQDGKMESDSGFLTFKKGGRIDADFVRVVDTNTVLIRPVASTQNFWLAISNLCDADRDLLHKAPELLRKGNAVVAVGDAVPVAGEVHPESIVLSNSTASYEWERTKSEDTGTLTVQTLNPPTTLVIQHCPFDSNRWVTVTELSTKSNASLTRTYPKTNITIRAWCTFSGTTHSRDGAIIWVQKTYDCKQ